MQDLICAFHTFPPSISKRGILAQIRNCGDTGFQVMGEPCRIEFSMIQYSKNVMRYMTYEPEKSDVHRRGQKSRCLSVHSIYDLK